MPVLPIALLLIGESWLRFYCYLRERYSRVATRAVLAVLLVVTVGLNLRTSWDSQRAWFRHGLDSIGLLRQYRDDWSLLAQQLASVSQPSDTLATTAAGIIPYYTGLYTIDQLGLIAPDLSRYVRRDEPRAGHTRLLSGEALARASPQFLVGHPRVVASPPEAKPAVMVEDGWLERVTARYNILGIRLSASPPRYAAYLIRRDVAERISGSQSLENSDERE
jgi:hypothetical protein